MRIFKNNLLNGCVGIGTTSPGASLDINGTVKFSNLFSQSLSANGYAKIGSLIIRWGQTGNLSGGSSTTVPFPTAFPNNLFNVQCTLHWGSVNSSVGNVSTGGESTSGFTVFNQGSGQGPVYWFAIGN